MGFNKTKVLSAAEKFLSQGKIPAAIKEYEKIVEDDPEDLTTLNMLGDLYARTGDKTEAAKCFVQIADHYREQGFNLKAIAMYKKIDRLNPGTAEIASKLAPLYEAQGLVVEARANYLLLAENYTRANQSQKALEIYRKVADLDPNNTEIRLKLAAGYLSQGFQRDAAQAFSHAGAQFVARKNFERALDAFTKTLEITPNDHEALSGLVTAHMQLGTADEAAEVLERALANQPGDVELLSMLAYAYVEAEDAASAERATTALVEREATSYARFVEVAKLYLKANDADSATRLISSIAEQLLAGQEEAQLIELINEALARNPEHIEALRLLFRVHGWQQDEEGMQSALERLTDAAQAAGLVDEERRALTHLARLNPNEERYSNRLEELGGALVDPDDEQTFMADASSARTDVPTFESFMLMNEHAGGEAAESESAPAQSTAEFEWNTVDEPSADPSASFADLNDWNDASGSESKEASAAEGEQASTGFNEFDFSSLAPPAETGSGAKTTAGTTDREAMLRQELESVDFYLAQGYLDIARDTLQMVETQFGQHPEIQRRHEQLNSALAAQSTFDQEAPVDAPVQTSDDVEFTSFGRYDVAEEVAQPDAQSTDELDSAFMSLEGAAVSPDAAPPAAATPPPAAKKPGIDPGLAAVFDEFRTAVEDESDAASDGDYETHYNLGLAYKEMDLVDEAVEEFQAAVGMVSPQDGTPRYLQCCNLLGHCFMQKGMPRLAAMWFQKGLDAPGHTEDEYQALRFELATAYEEMGDLDKAIDVFTEVYGINVSYRGVAEKLRELQAQKTNS